MARIYALAKELNLDSKDLVDLVKKVGITGKGSALASLTDDEAQRVRDHLSGGAETAKAPAPASTATAVKESKPVAVREAVRPERKPVNLKPGLKPGGGAAKAPAESKPAAKPEPKVRAPAPLPPVEEPKAPVSEQSPAQTPDVRLPATSRRSGGG